MNVYVCTDHDIHYPVGGASVVVAETEDEARRLLSAALTGCGLNGTDPFTLAKLELGSARAIVLRDGEY